jgi:hypothetical protein
MVMLLVEEPEFRRNTLRYMAQAIRGTRRPWRRGNAGAWLATRFQLLAAACTGPALYLRARLASRVRLSRAFCRDLREEFGRALALDRFG